MKTTQEITKEIRKAFRATGSHKGWKLQYIGNILTLTCTEFDVEFVDLMAAVELVRNEIPEVANMRMHFSTNDTYAAVVNWAN